MRGNLRIWLLLMATFVIAETVCAQGIPNAIPCMGKAVSGMPVQVTQNTGPVPAWAMTSWPGGLPMTTYGPMYFRLPPLIQRFTSLHECGHASTLNPNEYAANCFALANGGFSPAEIDAIGTFYLNLPGVFPPQYGGSGPAFWQGTFALCPNLIPH
jgi:hypothetical protein